MAGGRPFWTFKTGVFCFIGMSLVSSKRGLGVFAGMTEWCGAYRRQGPFQSHWSANSA